MDDNIKEDSETTTKTENEENITASKMMKGKDSKHERYNSKKN